MELAQEAGHVGFFHYQFAGDRLAWTPGQCKLFDATPLAGCGAAPLVRQHRAGRPRPRRARVLDRLRVRREKESIDYRVPHADDARWLSSRLMLHFDAEGRAAQMIGVTRGHDGAQAAWSASGRS